VKRIPVEGGEDLKDTCLKLVAEAPAYAIFNGCRLDCKPGDTIQDLCDLYHQLVVCRDIHDA